MPNTIGKTRRSTFDNSLFLRYPARSKNDEIPGYLEGCLQNANEFESVQNERTTCPTLAYCAHQPTDSFNSFTRIFKNKSDQCRRRAELLSVTLRSDVHTLLTNEHTDNQTTSVYYTMFHW